MTIPDHFFRQIFRSCPHPYLILYPDRHYTIADLNDHYREMTGVLRDDVIGKPLLEVFSDVLDNTSDSGISDLQMSLERVCRCAQSDSMGVQKYTIPLRDGSGKNTVKYWSFVNTPILDENGSIQWIIHSVEEGREVIVPKQAYPEDLKGLIVVADENPDMREYLARLLKDAGYRIKTASNGEEALNLCRDSLPDLIISAVMMSVLDGIGVLKILRSDTKTALLPVILLSERVGEAFKTAALSAGADDYLTKPFNAVELVARIDGVIKLGKLRYKGEQFYQTIFSSVYESILILEENKIVDCNDMAVRVFETTKDKLIGTDILNPAYHFECKGNHFSHYLSSASEGNTTMMECSLVLEQRLHKTKILEMTLSPFGTGTDKLIMIARDITEKVEKEKLFKIQARQAQLGEMISMIAHQWRQPLAIINAIAAQIRLKELMKEEGDPLLIDNLIKIEQQCVHLSQTISDYRDLSNPNKEKESIILSQLAAQAIHLLDHTFKNNNVEAKLIIDEEINVVTLYNEVLQVLITLLKNSLDAAEENTIGLCKITIRIAQDDGYGVIAVHDNAGGILPDQMHKLFTPYFTTKNKKEGTGLGLYMSKMIIEEHCHGLLEVSSVGEETLFRIKLPKE